MFDYNSMTLKVNTSLAEPKNYTCKLDLVEYENKRFLSKRISATTVPYVFIIQVLDQNKFVEPSFYIQRVDSYGVVEVRFT